MLSLILVHKNILEIKVFLKLNFGPCNPLHALCTLFIIGAQRNKGDTYFRFLNIHKAQLTPWITVQIMATSIVEIYGQDEHIPSTQYWVLLFLDA